MDFEQKRRMSRNEEKYHIENLKIAREFSKEILKEFNELVRAIVLFGSNTHDTLKKNSDIDVMIVLDNVSVFVSPELREAYSIITKKLNASVGKNKIHIMTMNLSDLWDMCRRGDPVMINVLRYGLPIFDRDLIEPLQYLLEIGRIRPTRESIYNYMARSQTLLDETNKHIQSGVLDLYYSLIDMVHATLMSFGKAPPSPKEMPKIFVKTFKNNKKLSAYSKDIDEIYKIGKDVEHRKCELSGSELDRLKKKVSKIVNNLKKIVDSEISKKDQFEL